MTTAILLFDLVAGLLFLGLYGMRSGAVAADSSVTDVADSEGRLAVEDVKMIAIPSSLRPDSRAKGAENILADFVARKHLLSPAHESEETFRICLTHS